MLYDPSNPLHVESARLRFERLLKSGRPFELKAKRMARTLNQNAYLHLLLQYFASQYGESAEYVKRVFYKTTCNAELFVVSRYDRLLGRDVKMLKSSKELSSEEMALSIDRFKKWSAQVADIYLPDAENESELLAAQIEVERAARWG